MYRNQESGELSRCSAESRFWTTEGREFNCWQGKKLSPSPERPLFLRGPINGQVPRTLPWKVNPRDRILGHLTPPKAEIKIRRSCISTSAISLHGVQRETFSSSSMYLNESHSLLFHDCSFTICLSFIVIKYDLRIM